MRWMNLEPIIQSEVSQKEKNNYHILTHIYGIYKDGTDEPIFRAAVATQTLRTDSWTQLAWEGEDGRYAESNMETYTTIRKIDGQWEFVVWLRQLKPELSNNLEGWDGEAGGRDVQVRRNMGKPMTDPCWCLQKPMQYCKAISLQLKIN